MIFMPGAKRLMASSNRTWSLPLPVQPWQMASAPSARATSTSLLADDGPGKGGAQQIVLILGPHHHGGDDDVVHHLVHQVGHDQLGGAGLQGLFLQPLQLVSLSHVAGDGNDLGVIVVLFQPGDDDGCIQTAGIGEHNFLISDMV